jgi:hypothetical protein
MPPFLSVSFSFCPGTLRQGNDLGLQEVTKLPLYRGFSFFYIIILFEFSRLCLVFEKVE